MNRPEVALLLQIRHWFVLVAGVMLGCAGLVLATIYVYEAVIKRSGDPDQSLLFWYLPVLLIGVLLSVARAAILVLGYRQFKQPKAKNQTH